MKCQHQYDTHCLSQVGCHTGCLLHPGSYNEIERWIDIKLSIPPLDEVVGGEGEAITMREV